MTERLSTLVFVQLFITLFIHLFIHLLFRFIVEWDWRFH